MDYIDQYIKLNENKKKDYKKEVESIEDDLKLAIGALDELDKNKKDISRPIPGSLEDAQLKKFIFEICDKVELAKNRLLVLDYKIDNSYQDQILQSQNLNSNQSTITQGNLVYEKATYMRDTLGKKIKELHAMYAKIKSIIKDLKKFYGLYDISKDVVGSIIKENAYAFVNDIVNEKQQTLNEIVENITHSKLKKLEDYMEGEMKNKYLGELTLRPKLDSCCKDVSNLKIEFFKLKTLVNEIKQYLEES